MMTRFIKGTALMGALAASVAMGEPLKFKQALIGKGENLFAVAAPGKYMLTSDLRGGSPAEIETDENGQIDLGTVKGAGVYFTAVQTQEGSGGYSGFLVLQPTSERLRLTAIDVTNDVRETSIDPDVIRKFQSGVTAERLQALLSTANLEWDGPDAAALICSAPDRGVSIGLGERPLIERQAMLLDGLLASMVSEQVLSADEAAQMRAALAFDRPIVRGAREAAAVEGLDGLATIHAEQTLGRTHAKFGVGVIESAGPRHVFYLSLKRADRPESPERR